MPASFFLAELRNGQAMDPRGAIKLLHGGMAQGNLTKTFYEINPNYKVTPRWQLPPDGAILMKGTTDELQQALSSDLTRGLEAIMVEDLMALWYVRLPNTETVVSIASVQGYWGLKMNEPTSSGYPWLRMYQGYTWKGGISLDVLVNILLPMAGEMPPWDALRELSDDEEKAPRAADAFLRSLTPQGLAMSPDPAEVLFLGDFQTVFNDAARNDTISYMNKNITDMNDPAKQRIQIGFPRVAEQFMQDVGRCEIRVGGDRTHGTLLKASGTGDEDPRKVLRQFAGTDTVALNLSKFLNQFIPTSIFITGGRVALANAKNDKLIPRLEEKFPKALILGNLKTQFLSVQKAGSFVIDYAQEQALNGFAKGMDAFSLDGNKSWLKGSAQISISAGILEAGQLTSYTFTKPPQITIHTEVTKDSLYKQAAGQVL